MDNEQQHVARNIDINNPDFYDNVQQEIETLLAYLKKNVAVVISLRIAAAEMEVETAALYHAELFYYIDNLKSLALEIDADE